MKKMCTRLPSSHLQECTAHLLRSGCCTLSVLSLNQSCSVLAGNAALQCLGLQLCWPPPCCMHVGTVVVALCVQQHDWHCSFIG